MWDDPNVRASFGKCSVMQSEAVSLYYTIISNPYRDWSSG